MLHPVFGFRQPGRCGARSFGLDRARAWRWHCRLRGKFGFDRFRNRNRGGGDHGFGRSRLGDCGRWEWRGRCRHRFDGRQMRSRNWGGLSRRGRAERRCRERIGAGKGGCGRLGLGRCSHGFRHQGRCNRIRRWGRRCLRHLRRRLDRLWRDGSAKLLRKHARDRWRRCGLGQSRCLLRRSVLVRRGYLLFRCPFGRCLACRCSLPARFRRCCKARFRQLFRAAGFLCLARGIGLWAFRRRQFTARGIARERERSAQHDPQ